MTIELFRVDPYCVEFGAQVMDAGPDYVVLDQTCFFAKSLEQASDQGWIDTFSVVEVVRIEDQIRHSVDEAAVTSLQVGDIVGCKVDWERRYRTMRLHTAQHLLHLAMQTTYSAGPPIGGAVDDTRASIEYSSKNLKWVDLYEVQYWIDAIVARKHLTIHEADQSLDQTRHWHIDGLAAIRCDGTHVRSTNEVGSIAVTFAGRSDATIELHVELLET